MKFFTSSNGAQPVKVNDENKEILFCKRAFFDVVGGITSKHFQGASPQNPFPSVVPLEESKIHFDLLLEIFHM